MSDFSDLATTRVIFEHKKTIEASQKGEERPRRVGEVDS
jgi:hypothetical protein